MYIILFGSKNHSCFGDKSLIEQKSISRKLLVDDHFACNRPLPIDLIQALLFFLVLVFCFSLKHSSTTTIIVIEKVNISRKREAFTN